jgi:hypothetical protein
MRRKLLCCCFLSAVLLPADDPQWMNKRIAEWSEQDVKQILTKSPWVKETTPGRVGVMTSSQRRDGGDMRAGGGGQGGVGKDAVDGVGLFGGKSTAQKGKVATEAPLSRDRLQIRWESAMPIRVAEFRANEPNVPALEGDEYAIAVYNVSLKAAILELKGLNDALKRTATLKVAGKPDLKPARVAVIEPGGGFITAVYLFPRAAKLSIEDARIDFVAQLGLVFVAQSFYPQEMRFQGKLEL